MNDKISVVVPIYNVEKYLKRCIESIIDQSYENIEIILVDDGSPDCCGKMCDSYLSVDSRIKVIHQENRGLSEARNSGIEKASGKYIVFIDSDDYIAENMIEKLYENIIRYDAQISCCGHCDIYEDSGVVIEPSKPENIKIMTAEEALSEFLFTDVVDVVAWNKLYSIDLFKNVRYKSGKYFEDHFTTYKLIDQANRIVNTTMPLYFYCKRSASIGGSSFSEKNYQLKDAVDEECAFIIKKYPKIKKDIAVAYINWLLVLYDKIVLARKSDDNLLKYIRRCIKNNTYNIIKCNKLKKSKKIQIFLLFFNKKIYYEAYCWYISKYR